MLPGWPDHESEFAGSRNTLITRMMNVWLFYVTGNVYQIGVIVLPRIDWNRSRANFRAS